MTYLTPQERSLVIFCGATLLAGVCLACFFSFSPGFREVISFCDRPVQVYPVDVNVAGERELVEVPGIGPATARLILEERGSGGLFEDVDDLTRVRGIGPVRLRELRRWLCAGCGGKR